MQEYTNNYNFNSLYICLLIIIYNIYYSNYEYINIFLTKIYLLNYTSFILIISIIGLLLFLRNLSIKMSIKYK